MLNDEPRPQVTRQRLTGRFVHDLKRRPYIGPARIICRHRQEPLSDVEASRSLYEKLERAVVPCFYRDRPRFLGIMRNAIALNASFFNTQRMMLQYLYDAYQGSDAG